MRGTTTTTTNTPRRKSFSARWLDWMRPKHCPERQLFQTSFDLHLAAHVLAGDRLGDISGRGGAAFVFVVFALFVVVENWEFRSGQHCARLDRNGARGALLAGVPSSTGQEHSRVESEVLARMSSLDRVQMVRCLLVCWFCLFVCLRLSARGTDLLDS